MRTRIVGTVRTVRFLRLLTLGAALVALVPSEAPAQQVAGLIKNLFDKTQINGTVSGVDHSSHFFLGGENLELAVRQLNVAIAAQVTQFPLASSSGGFTFSTNPRGEIVTTSTTFGPLFAQRAVTIGRKQLNFGFTVQGTSYESFDGQSLDAFGSGLRFISKHNDCCPATIPRQTRCRRPTSTSLPPSSATCCSAPCAPTSRHRRQHFSSITALQTVSTSAGRCPS